MLQKFYIIVILSCLTSFVIPNNSSLSFDCIFKNPDSSLAGIKLRDPQSAVQVLGKKTKLQGDSTHRFYSKNRDQILYLRVHPGDYFSQVSIFKVSYAPRYKPKYRNSSIENFTTEKGIRLGISKASVISKLGRCYTSTIQRSEEIIFYRLEIPQDSKTKLLERQNMPIYYSEYKFKKEKLVEFEFGFEYP